LSSTISTRHDKWLAGASGEWSTLVSAAASNGSSTTSSLPAPAPALFALTAPPCSSTSL
jgi:hypothetical protein